MRARTGSRIDTTTRLADAVEAAVARQLALLPRKEIAGASWRDFGAIIEVGKLEDAITLVEKPRDLHLAVDRALAPDLGRVRGQYWRDQRIGKEVLQRLARHAGYALRTAKVIIDGGQDVALADTIPATTVTEATLPALFRHELRAATDLERILLVGQTAQDAIRRNARQRIP